MTSESRKDAKVCQAASRLLTGLKLAPWLPHYDRATIRDVVAEMGELFKHLHHNLDLNRMESSAGPSADGSRAVTITFLDTSLRRNRQCVLSYLNYRQEKIRDLLWSHVGATTDLPDSIKERLDQDEDKFLRKYHAVIAKYNVDLNDAEAGWEEDTIDILSDLLPPHSVSLEVELLVDTEAHKAGTRFLARRFLVETLVLQGMGRHINSDTRLGNQKA
jgi:hypothetical protein